MRRVCLLAIVALEILDKKFDNHALLKDGAAEHFLLESQADLEPLGVWLRPNEAGVKHFHSL